MKNKGLYPGNFILEVNKQIDNFPKPSAKPAINKNLKRFVFVFLFITSITVCAYIGYNAYKYSKLPGSVDDIPMIYADVAPLRSVPNDPGGTRFDNQDKLIYRNLEDPSFKHKDEINQLMSDEVGVKEKNNLRTPARDVFAAKAKKEKAKPEVKKEAKKAATTNPFELIDD